MFALPNYFCLRQKVLTQLIALIRRANAGFSALLSLLSPFLSLRYLGMVGGSFLQLSGLEPVLTTSSPSAAGRHKNIVTVSYLHSKCNFACAKRSSLS